MSYSAALPSTDETLDITHALGDPTRYGIYREIVEAAGEPLTVVEVAQRFSLHPNVARMHLQKLVDVRLVQADIRKSAGGGRPARIYSLGDRVANLQFPPRDYRLLASLALQALEKVVDRDPQVLEQVGFEMGHEEGRRALRRDRLDPQTREFAAIVDGIRNTCAILGLFPRVGYREDGVLSIELRNCVFRELSADHPQLVCALHTAMLRGILDAYLDGFEMHSHPHDPTDGSSCVFSIDVGTGRL